MITTFSRRRADGQVQIIGVVCLVGQHGPEVPGELRHVLLPQFLRQEQPDLNWENPAMRRLAVEMPPDRIDKVTH